MLVISDFRRSIAIAFQISRISPVIVSDHSRESEGFQVFPLKSRGELSGEVHPLGLDSQALEYMEVFLTPLSYVPRYRPHTSSFLVKLQAFGRGENMQLGHWADS